MTAPRPDRCPLTGSHCMGKECHLWRKIVYNNGEPLSGANYEECIFVLQWRAGYKDLEQTVAVRPT